MNVTCRRRALCRSNGNLAKANSHVASSIKSRDRGLLMCIRDDLARTIELQINALKSPENSGCNAQRAIVAR
jgi:hypothetical protein